MRKENENYELKRIENLLKNSIEIERVDISDVFYKGFNHRQDIVQIIRLKIKK